MKNNDEFAQMQRDHIKLNKTRRKQLGEHMTALDNYLSHNLPGFLRTERQGSHALRTIIRPTTDDAKADADILVMMEWDSADHRTYVPKLAKTLKAAKQYKGKVEVKNRCVTVEYSEPSKCEVDLVPCVERDGRFYICPRNGDDFIETDGTGYREWFNEKNRITSGNLKRAVRLLKYSRDHSDQFDCPSIALTTLAGLTIKETDEKTEAVSTQADTLVTVLTRMSARLEKMPYPPSIQNPALPSETFNPDWSETKYEHFKTTIRRMARDAQAALDETGKDKSLARWQKVCGDKFAVNKGSGGGGSGGVVKQSVRLAPAGGIPVAPRMNQEPLCLITKRPYQPLGEWLHKQVLPNATTTQAPGMPTPTTVALSNYSLFGQGTDQAQGIRKTSIMNIGTRKFHAAEIKSFRPKRPSNKTNKAASKSRKTPKPITKG